MVFTGNLYVTTDGPTASFKVGEPITLDNPLPVTTDLSKPFKVGEPISPNNPLPIFLVSEAPAP